MENLGANSAQTYLPGQQPDDDRVVLATVGMVKSVTPIPGANRVESAEVVCGRNGKWNCIVQRGQFKPGDLVNVYLQDSLLPETEEFEFMRPRKFRVRMLKVLGTPSEALVTPLKYGSVVGEDVTDLAGVRKYVKVNERLRDVPAGLRPAFIPKTDEPNFQSVPHLVDLMRSKRCYLAIKYDGTSNTVYRKENGELGVCSRNLDLKFDPSSPRWELAVKLRFREALSFAPTVAFQMELCGPRINHNRLGLSKPSVFVFDAYDWRERRYLSLKELKDLTKRFNLPMVRLVKDDFVLESSVTDGDLRALAEQEYQKGVQAEGVVLRTVEETRHQETGERASVKILNLNYND